MSRTAKMVDYLKDHPTATNAELSDVSGLAENSVRGMLKRLRDRGNLVETESPDPETGESVRHIEVMELTRGPSFKREVMEMMVSKYLEDFESAELYTERIEIGKLILRILEKI